ncbi:hypothetical protein I601_2229 [Nocardioides dokdonensis FR1436]|uniref:YetF C-terminal domain-containing protein n=1 Tax=Nocardioides dokdonensis FR1436 TaxID=1300347 RepID=A0A1A9GK59_9ACTN|nr:YetF domain-containing protein [Nocardioides dokdonensis]ANH38654.1 hypothetical protein I601_2229 [Nocardioides dokdonensis FR1436]
MDDLVFYLGLPPLGALAVVVSTIVLYLAITTLLTHAGQRLYASPSSLDLAVVTVLGAIVGRAILGQVPTLSGGLLALGTLFVVESVAGRVRRSDRMLARRRHRAVAVMVAGRVERHELHRLGLDESVLWSELRGAGVRTPQEVAVVVVEPDGRFSVLRRDEEVHPAALTGVKHSVELLERLAAVAD